MSKHTPGPWMLRKWKSKVGAHAVDATDPSDGKNFGVCDVWGINNDKVLCDISEANARLIADAPELLAALQQISRMVKWAKENQDSPKSSLSHFISFETIINAAIAKATGE